MIRQCLVGIIIHVTVVPRVACVILVLHAIALLGRREDIVIMVGGARVEGGGARVEGEGGQG